MPETYSYRSGYRWGGGLKAAAVGAELEQLRTEGPLTAARVVEAAEPEEAPLHPAFQWDDTEAAQQYRLIQARALIRAVVIVREISEGVKLPAESVYAHVPRENGSEGKYVPLQLVSQETDEYERALTEARKFLDAAHARFDELRKLGERRGGKAEALAIAAQGFQAVQQALALLA